MTGKDFSDYWANVEKLKTLPNTAIQQLPNSLSENTKRKLMKIRPEESVKILIATIEQINRGSVESIDTLVRKQLWQRKTYLL